MDIIALTNYSEFALKAREYASQFNPCVILDSCGIEPQANKGNYKLVIGFGGDTLIQPSANYLDSLYKYWNDSKRWLFGVIGYDIKNEIENLSSLNSTCFKWPDLLFFAPDHILTISWNNELTIYSNQAESLFNTINQFIPTPFALDSFKNANELHTDLDPERHSTIVNALKEEIKSGNVYEMNLCSRFLFKDIYVANPYNVFHLLTKVSPSPFSGYFKVDHRYVLCASPERYLSKQDNTLVSQPIKGTRPRDGNLQKDEQLKQDLLNDEKDRAENVMIVDLVRNDLSRVSKTGTVAVKELFGIYSYSHVHQMVSTIQSQLDEQYTWKDLLVATFPMGSMTGAPKIAAMKFIEKFELSAREWYSGALGYIDPNGNLDFNVLIRSVFYDSITQNLAWYAGGAITIDSDPEAEYKEMMIKAKAIHSLFHSES